MNYTELVERVAADAGLPKTVVTRALRSFVRVVWATVADGREVDLRGLGIFFGRQLSAKPLFGGCQTRMARRTLRFRASRRKDMEKLAVVIDDENEKTKTAGVTTGRMRTCPSCGTCFECSVTNVPCCPNCGTEPFEAKNREGR